MKGHCSAISVKRIGGLAGMMLAALSLVCAARVEAGIERWSALQAAVEGARSGDVIVLSGDLTAAESDAALTIPAGVLLIALLLAVWPDDYLDRDRKRVMLLIIALVFSLVIQNYFDNRLSSVGAYNVPRTPVTIYGYAVRPVILALFLHIVRPGDAGRCERGDLSDGIFL